MRGTRFCLQSCRRDKAAKGQQYPRRTPTAKQPEGLEDLSSEKSKKLLFAWGSGLGSFLLVVAVAVTVPVVVVVVVLVMVVALVLMS